MMATRGLAAAVLAASLCVALPAQAQVDIPSYTVLSCEKNCPPVTTAARKEYTVASYPRRYLQVPGDMAEALVDIDFTIGTDGKTKNVVVEYLLGPQAFADSAISAVSDWTYDPATEGSKPVEENHRVRFLFRINGFGQGARDEVISAYRHAQDLAGDGKLADSIAAFEAIEARPVLNLYERSMVAFALAEADVLAKDYVAGRDAIRIATLNSGQLLGDNALERAIRLRIRLEAVNGDFAESFVWYGILTKKFGDLKPDDPIQKLVDQLHAMVADNDPISGDGRVPKDGTSQFWQHTLLRRSFEFHDVSGKLDKFELHCDRHSILSRVSDQANWTVPASWSGCYINVYGDPGTTFHFYEYPPHLATAATAPDATKDQKSN